MGTDSDESCDYPDFAVTVARAVRNGKSYIRLATTGGVSTLDGPIVGTFDHIVWVTMTDDGPVMANLLLEGILDDEPCPQ